MDRLIVPSASILEKVRASLNELQPPSGLGFIIRTAGIDLNYRFGK